MSSTYHYDATITRWVDGDTLDAAVDVGFRLTANLRFRLHGIDTPERGQPGWAEATTYVTHTTPPGTLVQLDTYKDPDHFGRWLAVVWDNTGTSINQQLLDAGLAKEYRS